MWWMVNKACCHHWVGWCLISKCAPFLPGRHIEKLDTVLEFGGRYATTTCAIALQQENSGHINHHHHHHIILCQYLLVIHTGIWDLCIKHISPSSNRELYYNNTIIIIIFTNFKGQQYRGRKKTFCLKSNFFTGRLLSVEVDPRSWMIHEVDDENENEILIKHTTDACIYRLNLSCSCRHLNFSHQKGLVVQVLTTNKAELRTYSRWTRRGMDATATHCLVPLDPKMSRSHQYQID